MDAICEAFQVDRKWLMTGANSMTGGREMLAEAEKHAPFNKEDIASHEKMIRQYANLTQEKFGRKIGYPQM